MNRSVESFLYGMQFRKLLQKELQLVQKEYGLNSIDTQVMFYLYKAGDRNTSSDIMQLQMFTRGHISQSLGRLQKKGYIVMEQDEKDRRCTHNYLTEDAREILLKLQNIFDEVEEIIFQGVTEEERQVFAAVVQKVSENISHVISS